MKPNILIVGAGPVGLALAAALTQHGVGVRVIERASGPTPFSKAVGVHARTLEGMHALGLTEQLVSDGHPLHGFALHQGGRAIIQAGFDDIDSAYPFVLGLPQSRTERRLLARFEALGGTVEWSTELAELATTGMKGGERATVRIQRPGCAVETAEFDWVVGADGSRSTVRQHAGIGFEGGDYGRAFILGDVRLDWDGPKKRLQFFLSRHGYLLVVPMPSGLHRIIAQTDLSYEEFQTRDRPQATLEDLQNIVRRNGPPGMRVHSPQWVTCAPFYHRLADTPMKGRVLLAGDAFHLFSPLGAQGLNAGFQDAFNLAWKLAFVEKGWGDDRLLQSYVAERQLIARRITAVTSKITQFVTATAPHQRALRFVMGRLYNPTARVQKLLPRMLAGQMQSYGPQAFLSDAPGATSAVSTLPPPGGRIPHAWILDVGSAGSYRPLASLVHGTRYSLLLVADRLDEEACESLLAFVNDSRLAALPFLQTICVSGEGATGASIPQLAMVDDRLGTFAKALGYPKRAAILVRPDGFCAMATSAWSIGTVIDYFASRGLGSTQSATGAQHAELADA